MIWIRLWKKQQLYHVLAISDISRGSQLLVFIHYVPTDSLGEELLWIPSENVSKMIKFPRSQAKLVLEEKCLGALCTGNICDAKRYFWSSIYLCDSSSASLSFALKMASSCRSDADFSKDDLTDSWRQRKYYDTLSSQSLGEFRCFHSAYRASCENLPRRELRFLVLVIIKTKSQNRMAVKDGCM